MRFYWIAGFLLTAGPLKAQVLNEGLPTNLDNGGPIEDVSSSCATPRALGAEGAGGASGSGGSSGSSSTGGAGTSGGASGGGSSSGSGSGGGSSGVPQAGPSTTLYRSQRTGHLADPPKASGAKANTSAAAASDGIYDQFCASKGLTFTGASASFAWDVSCSPDKAIGTGECSGWDDPSQNPCDSGRGGGLNFPGNLGRTACSGGGALYLQSQGGGRCGDIFDSDVTQDCRDSRGQITTNPTCNAGFGLGGTPCLDDQCKFATYICCAQP